MWRSFQKRPYLAPRRSGREQLVASSISPDAHWKAAALKDDLLQCGSIMADGGLEPSVTSVRGAGRLSSQFTGGPLAPAGAGGSPVNNAANGGPSPSGSIIVGNQRRFDEDVNLPLIKVVVLGAPGVGKTSVVKVNACIPNPLRAEESARRVLFLMSTKVFILFSFWKLFSKGTDADAGCQQRKLL